MDFCVKNFLRQPLQLLVHGKYVRRGEPIVTEPKTENSVREIYLSDEAIRLPVEDRKNHPFSPCGADQKTVAESLGHVRQKFHWMCTPM